MGSKKRTRSPSGDKLTGTKTKKKIKVVEEDDGKAKARETILDQEEEEEEAMYKCDFDLDLTLVERLKGDNPLDALRDIANAEAGEEGARMVREGLLEQGCRAEDLLRVLTDVDGNVKAKASDVVAVLNAVEAVFLGIASDAAEEEEDKPSLRPLGLSLCRLLLGTHSRRVLLLLSPSNSAHQARSALRALSAMVASGDAAVAREVLDKLDLDHDNFQSLARRRSKEHGDSTIPDVRTCYVHFLLSFLVSGMAKELLDKKTRLSSIFPGLVLDRCETVTLVLATLRSRVMEASSGVSKTAKMRLFSAHNLRPFLALFDWKGPRGIRFVLFIAVVCRVSVPLVRSS